MIRTGQQDGIAKLRELLAESRRAMVFTGAGISTESGIPDFRSPSGLWTRMKPIQFQDFVRSREIRREAWTRRFEGEDTIAKAEPNAGHRAIARLVVTGKVSLVVTQNIDGLHQAAGTAADQLIELHGTNAEVECVQCRRREPCGRAMAEFERTREPPTCVHCGALLKPAVVMFGQALDMALLGRALRAAERADLILALGSSLVVTPAADVPLAGARRGTPYVIVNRGETAHDRLATLRIDDDVVRVLPAAITRR